MMFKNTQFFVLLSLVLSSWALNVPQQQHDPNQAVFQFQHPSVGVYRAPRGVLSKFFVGGEERDEVVRVAFENNLDIWHATPTEVHIYTPEGEVIPPALLSYTPQLVDIDAPVPSSYSPRLSSSSSVSLSSPSSATRTDTSNWNLPSFQNTTYHSTYHPLFEIDEFLQQLQEAFPEKVVVREIGHSAEGREMRAVTISSTPKEEGVEEEEGEEEEGWVLVDVSEGEEEGDGDKDDDTDKKKKKKKSKKDKKKKKKEKKTRPPPAEKSKLGFVVVGAQHAREWIATAAALHFAHALTSNTSEPHSLGGLLDVYDFHIIPVPNPDGYDYTWEYDRFWYKNRQIIGPKAKCIGLDMNRNWGYKWKPDGDGNGMLLPALNASFTADAGFSTKPKPADPCSHWYPGLRAFEAPEANNIANFVNTLPDVVAFVDLRSYGQMLSSPYSYSCKRMPKDAEDQIEAALGATQALKKAYGTAFKTGSVCQNLYRAPGNIVDWMYARAGIKYSYVAHLRDTGTYGFSLPEKWIRPVGEETGNMIGYIAQFIAKQLGRSI